MEMAKNEMELVVTKSVVGVLETNIDNLEVFVDKKLQDYKPENYLGDADSAKKDRAELNNSKKFLTQSRIRLMNELMKPYEDFEIRCKLLERKIDAASCSLDAIVKQKEAEEKEVKKQRLIQIWESKNFNLFGIEKIFSQKWLNKTAKESDVSNEMDAIIKKTYSDLKMIERFSEDAETLKALYLETLDIGDTLDRGEELQKNRERLAIEKAEREGRETNGSLVRQQDEIYEEIKDANSRRDVSDIVFEALGYSSENKDNDLKEKKAWVLSFSATEQEVLELKQYLTDNGVIFDSCEEISF